MRLKLSAILCDKEANKTKQKNKKQQLNILKDSFMENFESHVCPTCVLGVRAPVVTQKIKIIITPLAIFARLAAIFPFL